MRRSMYDRELALEILTQIYEFQKVPYSKP